MDGIGCCFPEDTACIFWVDAAAFCCSGERQSPSPSEVVVLQEVGPLQHLHVALVDLEGGAESDRQAGQHVAALHQEEGLTIYFLLDQEEELAH